MLQLRSALGLCRSVGIYYRPWVLQRMDRFYRQFIGPGDLAFDIGSHVGNRIYSWSRLGARVVAVEPQASYARLLKRFFSRRSNVQVLQAAVGEKPASATLHVSDSTPTVSTIDTEWQSEVQKDRRFGKISWNRTESVEVLTMEQLISRYGRPKFAKVDVEGHELSVLKGLDQPLEALSFEYIAAAVDSSKGCIDRLESLDRYVYNWSETESMSFRSNRWLAADEMKSILAAMPLLSRSGDVYAKRMKKTCAATA